MDILTIYEPTFNATMSILFPNLVHHFFLIKFSLFCPFESSKLQNCNIVIFDFTFYILIIIKKEYRKKLLTVRSLPRRPCDHMLALSHNIISVNYYFFTCHRTDEPFPVFHTIRWLTHSLTHMTMTMTTYAYRDATITNTQVMTSEWGNTHTVTIITNQSAWND